MAEVTNVKHVAKTEDVLVLQTRNYSNYQMVCY